MSNNIVPYPSSKFVGKDWSIKIFKYRIFTIYFGNRIGWFRLFGVGMKWKDLRKHDLLFSERNGYTKYIRIRNWTFGYLKRSKII